MMRIGIDMGGSKIAAVALDPAGRVLHEALVPTPRNDYAATLAAVAALVQECERAVGKGTVGIGHPGAISPASGLIKNANSVWLNGWPLRQDLETLLQRPLRLANDANCFALSEAIDGAGAGCRTVFGVIIGTGTGGGVIVGGQALVGPNAVAGEWGHNPLPWPEGDERPGPACYCGRSGCIETFLSGPGLVRDCPERFSDDPRNARPLVQAAQDGNAAARAALDRYAERMARALASVINLLDPDVIVLGGGMSDLVHLYEAVPRIWGRWIFSDRVDTPLRQAVHGPASGVRGAAWLWPLDPTPGDS
jgi:fructokinase